MEVCWEDKGYGLKHALFSCLSEQCHCMSLVVMCDFDGTIVEIDTAEFVLGRFATDEWKVLDGQFERGEITLEECLRRQFMLVHASKKQMLDVLEGTVSFRPHFDMLVQYCENHSMLLVIVSAGLDFVIKHYLRLHGLLKSVTVCVPKTCITQNGVELTFPPLSDKTSVNFKQDLVRRCRKEGKTIAYVGDGSGDFAAAKEADHVFAIRDSRLAELCRRHGVQFTAMTDFQKMIDAIRGATA